MGQPVCGAANGRASEGSGPGARKPLNSLADNDLHGRAVGGKRKRPAMDRAIPSFLRRGRRPDRVRKRDWVIQLFGANSQVRPYFRQGPLGSVSLLAGDGLLLHDGAAGSLAGLRAGSCKDHSLQPPGCAMLVTDCE